MHGRPSGHEARVGARASHVEGQELREPDRRPDEPRPHDTARWTRQRERGGPTSGRRRRERPTGGRHDPERGDAARARVPIEPGQVGGDLGSQVGLRGGGADALELAEYG